MVIFTIRNRVFLNNYSTFWTKNHTSLTIYTIFISTKHIIIFLVIVMNTIRALLDADLAFVASLYIPSNNIFRQKVTPHDCIPKLLDEYRNLNHAYHDFSSMKVPDVI